MSSSGLGLVERVVQGRISGTGVGVTSVTTDERFGEDGGRSLLAGCRTIGYHALICEGWILTRSSTKEMRDLGGLYRGQLGTWVP